MANNNIQYTVKIDIDLTKDILNKLNQMTGSLKASEEVLTSMPMKFAVISTAINQTIAAAKQLFGYLSEPLQAAGKIEQYTSTLKNLLGNASLAKERLKELSDFAAITPFDLQGVVEAGNSLQTLNKYSLETLRTLGDLAAAAGKPVDQAIAAYTKLATGQRGIAIKMFRQLLITQRDWELATEKSVETHGKAIKKTGMTTADMLTALPEIIRKKNFAGLMDVQSKTLLGIESNLEDNLFRLKSYIGAIFSEGYKDSMQTVIKLMDVFIKNIQFITTMVKGLAVEVVLFIAVFKGVAIVELIMSKIILAIEATTVAIKTLTAAMVNNPWTAAAVAAVALGIAIYTVIEATKEDTEKTLANAKAQEALQQQLIARKEAEHSALREKKASIEKYEEEKKKIDSSKQSTDDYRNAVERMLILYPQWRTSQNTVGVGADALKATMNELTTSISNQSAEIERAKNKLRDYILLAAKAAKDKSIADLLNTVDKGEPSFITTALGDVANLFQSVVTTFTKGPLQGGAVIAGRINDARIEKAVRDEVNNYIKVINENGVKNDAVAVARNNALFDERIAKLALLYGYNAELAGALQTSAKSLAGAQLNLTYTNREGVGAAEQIVASLMDSFTKAADKSKWFDAMDSAMSDQTAMFGGISFAHAKLMGLTDIAKQKIEQLRSDNPEADKKGASGGGVKTKSDPLDLERNMIDENLRMLKLRSSIDEKEDLYLSPEKYAIEVEKIKPRVQKYHADRVAQAKAANKEIEASDMEYWFGFLNLINTANEGYLAKLEERTGKTEIALSRKNIDNHEAASLEATVNADNQKMLETKQAELDAIKAKIGDKKATEAEITRMYKLKQEINELTDTINAYAESLKFVSLLEKKTALFVDGAIPLDKFKEFFNENKALIAGSDKPISEKITLLTQQRSDFDTNLDALSTKESTAIAEDTKLSDEEKAIQLKELALKYMREKIAFYDEIQSIVASYMPTESADREATANFLIDAQLQIAELQKQLEGLKKPEEKKSFFQSLIDDMSSYIDFAGDAVNKLQGIFSDLAGMQQASTQKAVDEWVKGEYKKMDASEKSAMKFAKTENQKIRIAEKYEKLRADVDKKAQQRMADEGKTMFDLQKAAALASVAVAIAEGIAKAQAMGPILGWIYAALIAASGATQTAVIMSQEYPSYAKGGYTGDGNKFDEAGTVHKGEFVMDSEKTARYRPLLEFLHKETYVMPSSRVATSVTNNSNEGMLAEMRKLNSNFEFYAQQKTQVSIGDKHANRIFSIARKNINKGRL